MTLREFYTEIRRLAEPIYGEREASQIARMVAEEILGVSRLDVVLHPDEECSISEEECRRIEREISISRPIQYIIGEADFCDLRLRVCERVLIPRPESEELIRWITEGASQQQGQQQGRILDIGCGSGALSIALSVALPHYDVAAIEISDEAIAIATENAERYAPRLEIIKGDALKGVENYVDGEFDIILSNPPYIPQSEIATMRPNVTEFEPHLALFVPDDDPLLFYREIARSALKLLTPNGALYFEIHENFAEATKEMLHYLGYQDVTIRLDINDKARMICAQKEL